MKATFDPESITTRRELVEFFEFFDFFDPFNRVYSTALSQRDFGLGVPVGRGYRRTQT